MFDGSYVAIVTPMKADGQVDYLAFERLIAWHLERKTDGFVVLGTTGEAATITASERQQIIALAVSLLAQKKPLIIGTGTNCTQRSIELTREAYELGADAALLITPYYNKPTQEGLFQHYRAVAQAVPIPQLLYNNPGRTACDLLPDTIVRLNEFTNIVAIKETVPELLRYQRILNETRLELLGGSDHDALALLQAGGKGIISVVANIIPEAFSELCHAALSGDFERARTLHHHWLPLFDALFIESNPIAPKWALQQMGLIDSGIRLPLTTLSASSQAAVAACLKEKGIVCA